jgi:DUF971 family protein
MACKDIVFRAALKVTDFMNPTHLDLKKDHGLTVTWPDGTQAFYAVAYLRRMSPSADVRQLREEMARNPLTVLPSTAGAGATSGVGSVAGSSLTITHAELVGHYALKIVFSDGHQTGLYSWEYLRSIDPARAGKH